MSNETLPTLPPVHPRPGVLKTLGILNIVFSMLGGICILSSGYFLLAMMSSNVDVNANANQVQVEVKANAPAGPGVPVSAGFNPFMGMNDRKFLMFNYVENGVSLVISGLMFATGIGLLNQRRWAARGWVSVAWLRIVLLVLFWGYYVVGVAPSFSENMARNVVEMIRQQNPANARLPNVADMTRVYSILNLIVAACAILVGSIYPAISIWLLGRPGVKAALVDNPSTEPELT